MSAAFTIKGIEALQQGEVAWDTRILGLGCRCQKAKKSFVLKYRMAGRQWLYTLGAFGDDFTPVQARTEAARLLGEVRAGRNPALAKREAREAPVLRESFVAFLEEVRAKKAAETYKQYALLYKNHIGPALGRHQVTAVMRADVARLHGKMAATAHQANRTLAVLSSFFSWCIKRGHLPDGAANPCRHIDKYREKPRERFLSEAELCRLGQAIAWYEGLRSERRDTVYVPAALRLILLTGARQGEILGLRWADVDFDRRLIRLQESKTGQKTIYLPAPALQVLAAIPRLEGNPHVICGAKPGARLVNIKDPWALVRERAGMPGLRLHDLRHTYASAAVAGGYHLKVIGALLGHANTKTTERYAHLANDPLQAASEDIGRKIGAALAGGRESDNVVPLRSGG
jgi:integrase